MLASAVHTSFADTPDYIPCNYTVTINYYTNPSSMGNINGYTNGQSQQFVYNNLPCQDNVFQYQEYAHHPQGHAFSLWSASGGTLSSTVDNGTFLTVTVLGSSKTASITANFVMGLLVPLYIKPTTPDPNTHVTYWQDLINAKNSYSNVPIIAIANPDNGPNSTTPAAANSAYTSGMTNLTKAGILVLGYVYTCYGQRPLTGPNTAAECSTRTDSSTGPEDDINTWYSLYGSFLSGIFLDEMDSQTCGVSPYSGSYYSTITTFAHNKGFNTVVGNPGCDTTSTYVGTVDIVNPYEHSSLPTQSFVQSITTGMFPSTISSQWSILAYNVPKSSLTQAYVSSLEGDVGWMYVTDATGNPWGVLVTYLQTEVSYLANT